MAIEYALIAALIAVAAIAAFPGRHQSEQLVQHHHRQNVRLGVKGTPVERRSADRHRSAKT